MIVARTVAELRSHINSMKKANKEIGLVPTMGALHKGHTALVSAAQKLCDVVVVSIFVNPLQFGVSEDMDRYPRQEEKDIKLLEEMSVDIVYIPPLKEMYPEGFSLLLQTQAYHDILCASKRPGHFDGVATVVMKLFLQVQPSKAFFGEKDYQQLCIVRVLARDLDLDIRIFSVPTVREADGLAMSSRNALLTDHQRSVAVNIYQILELLAKKAKQGRSPIYYLAREGKNLLLSKGFSKVDYLEFRDAETLEEITNTIKRPSRIFVAAHLGSVRLIDNIEILP